MAPVPTLHPLLFVALATTTAVATAVECPSGCKAQPKGGGSLFGPDLNMAFQLFQSQLKLNKGGNLSSETARAAAVVEPTGSEIATSGSSTRLGGMGKIPEQVSELCPSWVDVWRDEWSQEQAFVLSPKSALLARSNRWLPNPLRFPDDWATDTISSPKLTVGAHTTWRDASGKSFECTIIQSYADSVEIGCTDENAVVSDRWCRMATYDINEDVFRRVSSGDSSADGFFGSAAQADWIILLATCVALCVFDFAVVCRIPKTLIWTAATVVLWFIIALAYNNMVWIRSGTTHAIEWATGYVLEWMLSMDNLMVFHLIFTSYKTPADQMHKALFVGIAGAVVIRMLFFMVATNLLTVFTWLKWPVAALLIWSGFEAALSDDDDETEAKDTRLIRGLKWCMGSRIVDRYEPGAAVFTFDDSGRLQVTLLFVVIACLEVTDVVFALDSVSAKVAIIPNQYVAFSSTVFAMFGLRAMFFIIKDLVQMFDLLKYGLCIILVFIGVELALSDWVDISSSTVCILIFSVFLLSIATSWMKNRNEKSEEASECDPHHSCTEAK